MRQPKATEDSVRGVGRAAKELLGEHHGGAIATEAEGGELAELLAVERST